MKVARRGDLFKSQPELKADALRRATLKGRANLTQTAIILGLSQGTVRAMADREEIKTTKVNALRYVTIEELNRLRGQG